jgi:hypothetical protein
MLECLFSLMPEIDLVQKTSKWYQAYTEAAFRFNGVLIKQWVRNEASRAAEEGFSLEDFLDLLQACRQCAIDVEGWEEDALSPADRAIDETLVNLRGIAWTIAAGTTYATRNVKHSTPLVTDTQTLDENILSRERRNATRCQLRMPIRVRSTDSASTPTEITRTASVSRTGLSFVTPNDYNIGTDLLIVYPYWGADDQFSEEYTARVVRKESQPEGGRHVAIRFLQPLGRKSGPRLPGE